MIFRSVPNPAVHRHGVRSAASKRFLEVTYLRKPPLNAGNRHAVVVELWWDAAGAGSSPVAVLVLVLLRRLESCNLSVFADRCLYITFERLRSKPRWSSRELL
jgi:uncharacterized protein (DUF2237 family)